MKYFDAALGALMICAVFSFAPIVAVGILAFGFFLHRYNPPKSS